MGNISELPDDLLLIILSFVPTKYIVATSLYSKRWRTLWTKMSRLTYEAPYYPDRTTGFALFVEGSLLSHQPHALETLSIDVRQCSLAIDIRPWCIRADVICNLRELEVDAGYNFGCISLPSALFKCKKLVVLKLKGKIRVIDPSTACLPSLKTLHLLRLRLLNNSSIRNILSSCPLVSDLRLEHVVMSKLHIVMPSLQRLTIVTKCVSQHSPVLLDDCIQSLEISTPSLNYLNIQALLSRYYVSVRIRSPLNLQDTSIYCRIVQLELNMHRVLFEELLMHLLLRSINLSVLKINNKFTPLDCWKPPSSVPQCLPSTLQTLEWRGYNGRWGEKELVSYLLKHALCLKTAKIFTESCASFEKQPMMDDLLSMPRASTTCLLVLE